MDNKPNYVVCLVEKVTGFHAPIIVFYSEEEINFDPMSCDGRELLISDYPYLAKCFETTYGASNKYGGDGVTTFALPDTPNSTLVVLPQEEFKQKMSHF